MVDSPSSGDTGASSVIDQLIEVIRQLPRPQQEYLLDAIKKWVKDDRDYPRIDYCSEVIYSDNSRISSGVTKNISATGVFIEPAGPFAVGKEIIMTFEHPTNGKPIKLSGKITRKVKGGIGINFDRQIEGVLLRL